MYESQPLAEQIAKSMGGVHGRAAQVGKDNANEKLLVSLSALQESFAAGQTKIERSLHSESIGRSAHLAVMKEKHALDLALAESKAEVARLQANHHMKSEQVDRERDRYEQELTSLRQAVQGKDKQIERLREELLARAEKMDIQAKEQATTFVAKENEWHTLRGGMETELAIYKAQAHEHSERTASLESKLEKSGDRTNDIAEKQLKKIAELFHQVEMAEDKASDLQRQLREQKTKTMEVENLLHDAQMAVHATGGSLQELRQANVSLKAEAAGLLADLQALQASYATATSQLTATNAELAVQRQLLAQQTTRASDLAEDVGHLRDLAERAQQTSLAILLYRDQLGDLLAIPPTSLFFDVYNRSEERHKRAAPGHSSSSDRTSNVASDGEEDEVDTVTSSGDTVSVATEGGTKPSEIIQLAGLGSMHSPVSSPIKRALTADDSGWFS